VYGALNAYRKLSPDQEQTYTIAQGKSTVTGVLVVTLR